MTAADQGVPIDDGLIDEVIIDGVLIEEAPAPSHVRSWSDVVHLVLAGLVLAVVVMTTRFAADGIRAVERDILRLLETVAGPILSFAVAVIQTAAAYAPLVGIVSLTLLRRFRRLVLMVAAGLLASGAMRLIAVLADAPPSARGTLRFTGPGFATGGSAFPSPVYIAAVTAAVVVLWPWLASAWRRTAVLGLVLVGFARLAAGTSRDVPPDLLAGYATGWLIGGLVLLISGRPNHRPRGVDIVQALARSAIRVTEIRELGQRRGGIQFYRAADDAGRALLVKVRRGGDWAADGAVRLYRNIRLRQPVGEHPFWTPLRSAEHEALVAIAARRAGAPVLGILTVTALGDQRRSALVAFRTGDAASLGQGGADTWADDEWSDDVLAALWAALAALRSAGIAHRNLHLGNIRRDSTGVQLVDFDRAELAADPDLLTNDVVELLCATATRVGPERAVAALAAALDRDALTAVPPRLQPLALSVRTRLDVRRSPQLLDSLRTAINQRVTTQAAPLAHLERIRPRTVLLIVMSAIALYFVVPEVTRSADAFDIDRLRQADIGWVAGALTASALSFVAAAVALWGAVPNRLPVVALTKAQIACQFANFTTPAQVGGMALNARFLQKRGTDPAVSVAAIGLNAATGAISHLALLGVFVYWAGTQDTTNFALPTTTIFAVLGVAVVVALLTLAVPMGRRFVRDELVPIVGRAVQGLRDVSRSPLKIAALVGGALALSATYIAALACAVYAAGGDAPLVSIGVVFLASSVVAAAAPTPGGLVAVEGALVAGLTGIGLDFDLAFGSVVIYRLATFWVPLAPGWLTFTLLQRRGDL